ncbi:unnamed protein product [Didymodactylos carnosus]|uniref:Uncharacterized protein n=1 Tax=Didymodactylos carnosus TaxID=1234261 RepID=A0A814M876_9BILA|nr:unnamed protein product [Didymodactylos carnosus]CAF1076106.1 unnamed protein product [Didymodactylos carnosus]CAF3657836.1 unnamed protein product [Didymodactylos carnosus]CAF3842592.1 unnamed protein product [Didymodactylos carnosus]
MSEVRARAMALTDPTRPEVTAFFKSVHRSTAYGVHRLPAVSSSEDEDDDDHIDEPQCQQTSTAILPDESYDTDLDSDDDDESKKQKDFTSKGLYLTNCDKNTVIPSSSFLKLIDNELSTSVDIRYSSIKPLDIKAMIPSLRMSTTITKLDLSGNGFGSLGAVYIAKLIKDSEYIIELNLSYNDIGLKGCQALCPALRTCDTIRTLILDGNRLNDECAVHLAELLTVHEYLLYVSLAKNLFEGVSAASLFAVALSDNQSIEHFNISFNHFQQKTTGVFVLFLSKNFRLRTLDLSYSSFGLDASKAFSMAMKTKNTQLEELDLSSNLIDDECAKYLASVVSTNESLKILKLMGNPLSINGCYILLKPLVTMPTSQLETIDIRDISIKSKALASLAMDLEDRFPKLVIKRGEKIDYPPIK